MDLAGTGLKVYTAARSFEMGSDVTVTLPGEKLGASGSGDVTIESEGRMTFAAGVATFFGRPVVSSGQSRILCDRLELHLDEKTEALKKGVAEGNVDIRSPEMTGKCEYAEWAPEDDRVHMLDNVFLRDKASGNTVRASSAKVVLSGNHVWCGGPVDALFYPDENDR